jgi:hypothetical protein
MNKAQNEKALDNNFEVIHDALGISYFIKRRIGSNT